MKPGPKRTEKSGYVLSQHKNGAYWYAYTLRPYTDENGKEVYKRIQWGRLDSSLKFYPFEKFLELPEEEKMKFIFPKEWDLSLLERQDNTQENVLNGKDDIDIGNRVASTQDNNETILTKATEVKGTKSRVTKVSDSKAKATRVKKAASSVSTSTTEYPFKGAKEIYRIGVPWLVMEWAKKIGLLGDLLTVFGGDRETVDIILSYVIYSLTEDYDFGRTYSTQGYVKYPTSVRLDRVSTKEFFASIDLQEIYYFFQLWAQRYTGKYYAIDSTNVAMQPEYGSEAGSYFFKKKEEPSQRDFVILYSETGYPICYSDFKANPRESWGIISGLTEIKYLFPSDSPEFSSTILLTQIGEASLTPLRPLVQENLKFVSELSSSSWFMRDIIRNYPIVGHSPQGMEWNSKEKIFFTQVPLEMELENENNDKSKKAELTVNLYYHPLNAVSRAKIVYKTLFQMLDLADQMKEFKDQVDEEEFNEENPLLNIVYSEEGYIEFFIPNFKMINEEIDLGGFSATASYGVDLDPISALKLVRQREVLENDLRVLKEAYSLNLKNLKNSDLSNIKLGVMFITFISLIITASLREELRDEKLLGAQYKTVSELVGALRDMSAKYCDGKLVEYNPTNVYQQFIAKYLGLKLPQNP